MKKITLTTLSIALFSIASMAQTKPVQPIKPAPDTIYHLTPQNVFNRAYFLQRAALFMANPDNFSVNEKKFIIKVADSLSNVDGTWYNKIKKP